MYDLVIIMPTYNENKNVQKLIPIIKEKFKEIGIRGGVLVIDDNSPDGTSETVEKFNEKISNQDFFVRLIQRPGKLGLATAYILAYETVINSIKTHYVLGMDADLSHSPSHLPEIYKALTQNDMVIGSRYVSGGGTTNWSPFRKLISKSAGLYCKILLWWNINDPTTAYTGFKLSKLKELDFHKIKAVNYGFTIELKYQAWKKKFRIKEVPIIFVEREQGESKFNKHIFIEGVINTFLLRFKYIGYK